MPSPKLLDHVRSVARMRHLGLSTERAYAGWIRRYILFHNKKHPKEMAEKEIREFISDLAVNAKISASTQTVVLSGLKTNSWDRFFRPQKTIHETHEPTNNKKMVGR